MPTLLTLWLRRKTTNKREAGHTHILAFPGARRRTMVRPRDALGA